MLKESKAVILNSNPKSSVIEVELDDFMTGYSVPV